MSDMTGGGFVPRDPVPEEHTEQWDESKYATKANNGYTQLLLVYSLGITTAPVTTLTCEHLISARVSITLFFNPCSALTGHGSSTGRKTT